MSIVLVVFLNNQFQPSYIANFWNRIDELAIEIKFSRLMSERQSSRSVREVTLGKLAGLIGEWSFLGHVTNRKLDSERCERKRTAM